MPMVTKYRADYVVLDCGLFLGRGLVAVDGDWCGGKASVASGVARAMDADSMPGSALTQSIKSSWKFCAR